MNTMSSQKRSECNVVTNLALYDHAKVSSPVDLNTQMVKVPQVLSVKSSAFKEFHDAHARTEELTAFSLPSSGLYEC
jgi:hypothetical protein